MKEMSLIKLIDLSLIMLKLLQNIVDEWENPKHNCNPESFVNTLSDLHIIHDARTVINQIKETK